MAAAAGGSGTRVQMLAALTASSGDADGAAEGGSMPSNLQALTMGRLREVAATHGVSAPKNCSKDKLVELLERRQGRHEWLPALENKAADGAAEGEEEAEEDDEDGGDPEAVVEEEDEEEEEEEEDEEVEEMVMEDAAAEAKEQAATAGAKREHAPKEEAAAPPAKKKKVVSAYMLWMNGEGRAKAKADEPSAGAGEINKLCAARWKEMDAAVKAEWEAKAAEASK